MEYLGCGGTRVVFLKDDCVVKIPYCRSGAFSNRVEAERYALRQSPRLAPCFLQDNGWLEMEHLPEDLTFDFACFLCGSRCDLYDEQGTLISPKSVSCDLCCNGCPHNMVHDYSDIADAVRDAAGVGVRVQMGRGPDGCIKVYDYGSTTRAECLEREPFHFDEAYLPLFMLFVEDGCPEKFAEWAMAHHSALPARSVRTGDRLREYNRRTRLRLKEEKPK